MTGFLVFARVGALFFIFPLFSTHNIPIQVRLALGGFLSLLITPLIPPLAVQELSLWSVCQLLFMEISVGVLLGFVCRMVFFAIEFAGALIATASYCFMNG